MVKEEFSKKGGMKVLSLFLLNLRQFSSLKAMRYPLMPMKILTNTLMGSIISLSLFADPLDADTLSKGVFILHKFQQPVGKEFYVFIKTGDSVKLESDFKFTDRGREVPLKTRMTTVAGNAVYFEIAGSTSRSSVIDTRVIVTGDSIINVVDHIRHPMKKHLPAFPMGGYAPVSVQMEMIRYWKDHQRPLHLKSLPVGELTIVFDGLDTVSINNRKEALERYFVSGLIWGKELLWINHVGELALLFTNDAEGDKFEAVEEYYLPLLPEFLRKAAHYGMMDMKSGLPGPESEVLALQNGTIIDVERGSHIQKGTILIQQGKILKTGPVESVPIPRHAKIIDVSGKYLIPGLWDMHAHFQQVEWGPAYLASGVTTVRDCGNEFDFINAVQEAIDLHHGVGPRIMKTGIVDGDGPMALGIVRVNTAEDARRVVKKYKDSGFIQIKIYSSLKPEMIKAVSEESHALGMTTTGHVPRGVSVTEAIDLGQDQINHFTFILQAMAVDPESKKVLIDDPKSQAVLNSLLEHHTVVDPTLGIYEWIVRPLDQPVDAFEPGVNHLPENLLEIFKNTGMTPEAAKQRGVLVDNGKAIVWAMYQKGIPVVAGTDMMVPGYSLCRELELYQASGLSPLQALQCGTITPAKALKRDHESGSLAEGKVADVLVLDENPLTSISAVRKVKWVIKGGIVYDPADLRKLIDFKP
jgi:imidazolonepropionase-like amidohydrolase